MVNKAKPKTKRNPTTTRYLRNRNNPANPTNHTTKTGEYYDFRKLMEVVARSKVNEYILHEEVESDGSTTLVLEGKLSKLLEQFEEDLLISLGLAVRVGTECHVIQEKFKEALLKDEEIRQRLIAEKHSPLIKRTA